MSAIVKIGEELCWESPDGKRRQMGMLHERDITPTKNMSAGTVRIPEGSEQTRLSQHTCEEIYLIVKGRGQFVLNDQAHDVEEGHVIYVAPGTKHRAINKGTGDLLLYWVNSPPVFGEPEAYKQFVSDWKRIR